MAMHIQELDDQQARAELLQNPSKDKKEHDEPKYDIGVLAGLEWSPVPNAELSTEQKNALKAIAQDADQRDYPARLIEVIQSWEAALFYRGFQFLIPQRGGGWIIPGESSGYGPSMQQDLALLPTNIYSARAQMIIAALTRTVPNVRFAPQRADSDAQITAAESAEKFVKVIQRNNDLIMIQTDAARYLWCDGRFIYWSRFVKDGQKFGWEEDDEADDIVPETATPQLGAGQPTNTEQAAAAETPESQETAQEGGAPEGMQGDVVEQEAAEESAENAEEVETPGKPAEENAQDEEDEEDETPVKRTPRGQEVRTAHGKLETKIVPMMANDIDEADVITIDCEVDSSRAKAMFPWAADKIKAGENSNPSSDLARLARLNVKLGMQSTYITSDSVAEDVTISRKWMRPSWLMRIKDVKIRDEMIEMFPNGCLAVYAGQELMYVRNESMDDSLAIGQAYSGDGQNRNAMGTSTLPIQKRLNNWLDLMNDYFVRAIPKKWMDSKAFSIEALRGQTNVPGDIGGFKRQQGVPVNELIFVEPQVGQPESLAEFIKEYSGNLSELLSGAYPALAGGDTGTADSGVAIATQRDSALGRLAPTWHSMKNAEARSTKQLVRWGAKCRDGSINEKIPGGETISLEVNDLKANILCYAESDENFPETFTQKKNAFMTFFDAAIKNPQLAEVMFNAANLEYMQNMSSMGEVYIPQVASRNKQLGEIEVLSRQKPLPNPEYEDLMTKLEMMKAKGVDPADLEQAIQELEQMPQEVCSIPIDAEREDNQTEADTCWQFINGDAGRKLKRTNKDEFENVCLHFDAHTKAAMAKAAQAAQNQPGKPPSMSINYKDVAVEDPEAAKQMLLKDGVTPSAGAQAPPPVPAAQGAKEPAKPLPTGPPEQPPTRVQ